MPGESTKPKKVLFVDDDRNYLSLIQQLFSQLAKGSWEISTAQNHAQALEILRKGRVDLVVLDFKMPVMDGLQFLKLLGRTHPGQQVAILSGRADGAERKVCEESGALLVLQKPVGNEGFASVFSALDALASAAPQEGFRGMMRRLGIGEVLQMECLGSKSSVLEIFTGKVRGKIFICDGAIIHAETGAIQGETALYGLLGLTGGEFNFSEYTEPPRRTIEGSWEGLLMEA
ncbi:MAG: response regulator, partial [Limisphaerales bacterium]